jgi:5-methyltetrahydrofolate--homocysteine methyltransferase
MSDQLEKIYKGVMSGDMVAVEEGVNEAMAAGLGAEEILTKGMISAMSEVGRLFEEGEYFVPEMLIAARAMKGGLNILRPALSEADIQPKGKVAIGTVKGDLHDIGKNLVAMMLEGAGYEILDLGVDVAPEQYLKAVQNDAVDVVALSALLTTTMPSMKTTVEILGEAGVRDKVKVIVGGAPVTDAYAQKIGADGYSPDASQAVRLTNALLGV